MPKAQILPQNRSAAIRIPPEEAKRIQALAAGGSSEAALDALSHYKRLLLDTLHADQAELERIDDLMYSLKKGRSIK